MRTSPAVLILASLAACAGPSAPGTGRPPPSPARVARPEPDPVLLGTPPGAPAILPIEEIAVRVRRGPDGRVTLVEFLGDGLTESQRVSLRLAFEAGEVRLSREGANGEESWTTTLRRAPAPAR